jgi:hypothetical protein
MDPHSIAILKILLLAIVAVAFFVFHVWFRTYALTEGYNLSSKRRELSKLENQIIETRINKNKIMGPQSLKTLAQKYRHQGIVIEEALPKQILYFKEIE